MLGIACIDLSTQLCQFCRKTGSVKITEQSWRAYRNGATVQEAFPELDAPLREQIISGTHPSCWDWAISGK